MYKVKFHQYLIPIGVCLAMASCKTPLVSTAMPSRAIPGAYDNNKDTTNMSNIPWKSFFKDKNLIDLIDTALKNNQELMITLQEIEIAKNDIRIRKGALLPKVGARIGSGVEKVGRYTSQGAGDASADITPGLRVPDALMDHSLGLYANWEVDIWNKLHHAKKAALTRYLSSIEGKNFLITNLIGEVANSYYELLALDSKLEVVNQNIELQKNALEIVKIQKEASKATELAVQKFQAEVLASQNLVFEILQQIKETESRIHFLLGRYPEQINRDKTNFLTIPPSIINSGIPSQILANRPDIKQAELELSAAKLDVKVARAEFYPSLDISSALGLQAFKTSYLFTFPESMLYSLAGDITGPLINRNAIKAEFYNANSRQLQAMFNYQRTTLNAYLEVSNQLSKISNLEKSYIMKSQQVNALNKSIDVANDLFKSARADYLEVLMTQRDAFESKLELIETKKEILNSSIHVYRDLGGGWK